MALPIEETNLAGIGSDEDKAAREAASRMEFKWGADVGSKVGVEIWRVENKRTENDAPDFGIEQWPHEKYGLFHRGDSYIVLQTTCSPEKENKLLHDVYFWIGSESSQDEYGVASYKAVELDDILEGDAIQHRETEGNESKAFASCFPKGITYLEGGVESGFRRVNDDDGRLLETNMLYRIYKKPGEQTPRCFQVPPKCSSLNQGDAFLLDAGNIIMTWFGSSVSPFEKSKSAMVAHNIKENRLKDCEVFLDVDDDYEQFWGKLGGVQSDIKPEQDEAPRPTHDDESKKAMIKQIPLSRDNLVSDDVCLVDRGDQVFIWAGKGASENEKSQALLLSYSTCNGAGINHFGYPCHRGARV